MALVTFEVRNTDLLRSATTYMQRLSGSPHLENRKPDFAAGVDPWGQCGRSNAWKTLKFVFGLVSQPPPDSAAGAHDAIPDPIISWGGNPLTISHSSWRLQRLGPRHLRRFGHGTFSALNPHPNNSHPQTCILNPPLIRCRSHSAPILSAWNSRLRTVLESPSVTVFKILWCCLQLQVGQSF